MEDKELVKLTNVFHAEVESRLQAGFGPGRPEYSILNSASSDDQLMLNVLGKVYVTDGTSSGTSLVRDFGTAFYSIDEDSFYSSPVAQIDYVNGDFYIGVTATNSFLVTTVDGFLSTGQSSVWKSDGSSAGTQLLRDFDISTSVSSIFNADFGNGDNVFFSTRSFSNNSIENRTYELLDSGAIIPFDGLDYAVSSTPIEINNSYYFCGRDHLVTISNNGDITVLEDECNDLTLHDGVLYYYVREQGVYSSNGAIGGAELIMPWSDGNDVPDIPQICSLKNALYITNRLNLLRVGNGVLTQISLPDSRSTEASLYCGNEVLVIETSYRTTSQPFRDIRQKFVYDVEKESFIRVNNLNGVDNIYDFTFSQDGQIYLTGTTTRDFFIDNYIPLIRLRKDYNLTPVLMMLLDD